MAKQVTEDDLKAGLQSVGSLGALGGQAPGGTRRDSPFGTEFVKRTAPAVQSVITPTDGPSVIEPRPAPAVVAPPVQQEKATESKLVSVPRSVKPVEESRSKRVQSEAAADETSNSAAFTERVTLQMTPEMRDDLLDLARKLHRQRREKGERITANSLMRVGIKFLLEEFRLTESDRPSNEEELMALIQRKLAK